MTATLASAGVEAAFFDAVDARAVGRAAMAQRCRETGPWGRLRLHDMACTLSHLDAMRAFLDGPASHCLILEDDVFLSPELKDWLADLSWWPADADVVKIERWRARTVKIVMGRVAGRHLGRELRRLHSRHQGTGGYMLSRAGAETILAHQPVNLPIDHLLFNMNASPLARSLRLYQIHPALVRQGNDPPPQAQAQATATPPAPAGPPERETGLAFALRELRRGWYEISRLPHQAAQLLTGGVLTKPEYR